MLSGQRLYLDLQDKVLAKKLEQQISHHGGKVEKFLSRDISCIVTNRAGNSKDHQSGDLKVKTSHNQSSAKCASPCLSRGMALLMQSKKKTGHADKGQDPMDFANKWGIACWQMKDFLKEHKIHLGKREEGVCDSAVSDSSMTRDKQMKMMKVKRLTGPCLKFEDVGRIYKPQTQTFSTFPHIVDFHRFAPSKSARDRMSNSSSEKVAGTKENVHKKSTGLKLQDVNAKISAVTKNGTITEPCPESSKAQSAAKEPDKKKSKKLVKKNNKPKPAVEQSKSGYCESCDVFYTNLSDHIASQTHQVFATNKENFASLDDAISKLPGLEDLLCAVDNKNISAEPKHVHSPLPEPFPEVSVTKIKSEVPDKATGMLTAPKGLSSHDSSVKNQGSTNTAICDIDLKPQSLPKEQSATSVSQEINAYSDNKMISCKVEHLDKSNTRISSMAAENSPIEAPQVKTECSCLSECTCNNNITVPVDLHQIHEDHTKKENHHQSPCQVSPVTVPQVVSPITPTVNVKHFDVDAFICDTENGSSQCDSFQQPKSDLHVDEDLEHMDFQFASSDNFPSSWMAPFEEEKQDHGEVSPGGGASIVWSSGPNTRSSWGINMEGVCDRVLGILDGSDTEDGCISTKTPLQELCCYNRSAELVDSNSVSPQGTDVKANVTSAGGVCDENKDRKHEVTFSNLTFTSKNHLQLPEAKPSVSPTRTKHTYGDATLTQPITEADVSGMDYMIGSVLTLQEQGLSVPGSMSPPSVPDISAWDINTPPGDEKNLQALKGISQGSLTTPPHDPCHVDTNPQGAEPWRLNNLRTPPHYIGLGCSDTSPACDKGQEDLENLLSHFEGNLDEKDNVRNSVENLPELESNTKSEVSAENDDLANMSLPADIVNDNLESIVHALNGDEVSPRANRNGELLCSAKDVKDVGLISPATEMKSKDVDHQASCQCVSQVTDTPGIRLRISLKSFSCSITESKEETSSDSEIDVITCSPLKPIIGVNGLLPARNRKLSFESGNSLSSSEWDSETYSSEGEDFLPQQQITGKGDKDFWSVSRQGGQQSLKLCLRRVISTPKGNKIENQAHLQWQVKRSGDCKITLSSHQKGREGKNGHFSRGDKTISRRKKLQL